MEFSLAYSVLLWIYAAGVLVVLLFSLSSLYHLMRFGFLTPTAVAMTFILLAGTLMILFASYRSLAHVDWQRRLRLLDFLGQINPVVSDQLSE